MLYENQWYCDFNLLNVEFFVNTNTITISILLIEATVRTKTNEPIWTKQYPYSYADKEFVNNEFKKLLENNIIEKSFSPYNAPIVWVVPKKGVDTNGKPERRLVIDFQKLNAQIITDKYPIPDIIMTEINY